MLRPLLLALLGVSVAANAWLALAPRPTPVAENTSPSVNGSSRTASPDAPRPAPPATANPPAIAADNLGSDSTAPRGLTWRPLASDEDYRRFADDLRAAGFPPRVIATLVRDLYLKSATAHLRPEDTPFWQQMSNERSKEMQDIFRGLQPKLESLLGPDARASLLLDPLSRERRYGALSDAKIDAIATVERDYDDMQQDVYRSMDKSGFTNDAFRSQQDQTKLLQAEKLADLAKFLSPAELADYELRNSNTSRGLARTLTGLDVTPEQFAALYPARKAYDEINQPAVGRITPEAMAQRAAAQNAYYDTARALLPADTFYSFLANSDTSYRAITQLPNVTAAAAYSAWSVQQELTQTMSQFRTTRPSSDQIQALYADYNRRLDSALGAEAAAAYRKTPRGRLFNTPVLRAAEAPAPRK